MSSHEQALYKKPILETLSDDRGSSLRKYQELFVGSSKLGTLLKFEFCTVVLSPMPGALGILLRKWSYPFLFRRVGSKVLWGRNVTLRHPEKMEIGNRVVIDDGCLLDAKGVGDDEFRIGNDVLIARDTIIQGKCGFVDIADRCVIGSQCHLHSGGGIRIGKCVMVAGQCYIGGGRYGTDNKEIPMMDQGLYTRGPVVIEDDVWLGAGVIVLDGVTVGKGSLVGAGTIVSKNIPAFSMVAPYQKIVILPRGQS